MDIDERGIGRNDSHGAPLPRGLQGAAQQRGGVVSLSLADLGLDTFLHPLLLIAPRLRGHARVKGVHADVEPFFVRNLTIGLDRVDLQERLGLVDDAPTQLGEQHEAASGRNRAPFRRQSRRDRLTELAGNHFPALFL